MIHLKAHVRKHLNGVVINLGLVVCGLVGVHFWQTRHLLPVDAAAPAISGTRLDGARFDGGEALGSSPKLLYFFAPWCVVCRTSMSNLNTLESQVIAVALAYESKEEVLEFLEKAGVDGAKVPVVLSDDATSERFAISAFPTYYVMGRDGRVFGSAVGYSTFLGMRVRLWLAQWF